MPRSIHAHLYLSHLHRICISMHRTGISSLTCPSASMFMSITIFLCIDMSTYVYISIYLYTYIYIHIYIYVYTYTHIYIYIPVHM